MKHPILLLVFFLLICSSPVQADQKGLYVRAIRATTIERAEAAANRLKRHGTVNIARQDDRYVVWIGPVENRDSAAAIREDILARHPNAVVGSPDPALFMQTGATAAAAAAAASAAAPESLSPDAIHKEGMEHYAARRYEGAIEKLSLFLSLYPAHDQFRTVMTTLAGILVAMKRPLAAIRLYSRVLERYPGTPESLEAMIALADLSTAIPGLKSNIALAGSRWYLDPIEAYDMALSKTQSPEMTERILLQRIVALRSQKRYREAYAESGWFVERHPGTKHRQHLLAALRSDVEHLIEERFAAGDDIAVINLFSNARRRGLISLSNTDLVIQAAESYARIGIMDEAKTLLGRARFFAAENAAKVDAQLQAIAQGRPPPAVSSPVMERWSLYGKGRQQIQSSNIPAAEKTLAQLKGADPDAFWTKLVDFALQDGLRTSKYKDHLK